MSGDTWGISGPLFLAVYVPLLAASWAAILLFRRSRKATRHKETIKAAAERLATQPVDAAYLNKGRTLAVVSALSALHAAGAVTVTPSRTVVATSTPLPAELGPVERAVHAAASSPVKYSALARVPAVHAELVAARRRLADSGLMVGRDRWLRDRLIGLPMIAVLVLGIVRFVVGIRADKPVGFLFLAIFVGVIAAIVLNADLSRRTRRGNQVLSKLRKNQRALAPRMNPRWATYGPLSAALSVGIYGTAAAWAADPAFAAAIALPTSSGGSDASTASSAGGGGYACGGGGGGGGGGCGG